MTNASEERTVVNEWLGMAKERFSPDHSAYYVPVSVGELEAIERLASTPDLAGEPDAIFEVWQDGYMVAAADSRAEAEHYMVIYGQDGPVEAKTAITTRFQGFDVVPATVAVQPAPLADVSAQDVLDWMLKRPGASWQASINDVSEVVAAIKDARQTLAQPDPREGEGR